MTDAALFGTSEEPAHVEGYGPIPAELAREIVAGACSAEREGVAATAVRPPHHAASW